MKKMFAASLVAIMAVSAANAEIASVSYTNKAITEKTGDLDTLATTAKSNLTAAVNELAGKVGDQNVSAQVSAALESAKDYTDELANGAVKANTDAIAALDNTYATDTALNNGLALKQDKAKMLNTLDGFSGSKAEYYPTVTLMETAIADANNEVGGEIADLADTVSDLSDTVSSNKSAADTGIQEAKDAAAAASTAAGQALTDAKKYTDDEVKELADGAVAGNTAAISAINNETTGILAQAKADATSKDTALENKITNAYEAADTALETTLKQYADDVAADASGEAGEVSAALDAYKTLNDAAVAAAKTQADKGVADAAAAKTQADKGVADAAAAKAAADAAQATANANAEAIEGLDSTYVKDSDFSTFQTSNTSAIATAKSEAIAAAKTAGDAAYDAKGAAAAAQTAAVNAAKTAADATYQVKSSALSVGAADGAWTDLTKAAGYSATGTHSLVLKNGTIQWEAVRYAE